MSRSAGVPGAASVRAAGTAGASEGASWATATWADAVVSRATERAATDISFRLGEEPRGELDEVGKGGACRAGTPGSAECGEVESIRFVVSSSKQRGVNRGAASRPAGREQGPVQGYRRTYCGGTIGSARAARIRGKPSIRPGNHPRRKAVDQERTAMPASARR